MLSRTIYLILILGTALMVLTSASYVIKTLTALVLIVTLIIRFIKIFNSPIRET
ncbi:MAG: hypothetical protein RMH77_03855 [Sulfolobales archaeon]|nr:hypothetical protein [Sulfolobales archaeon]MCX8185582.1 hypothetical protein [Sulfolobales archaeon]MDW7969525.1 hypothetical protein [Sulfolobales archaeon]